MPIKLITGPINSGKSTRLLDTLRPSIADGSAIYVVPTESTAFEFKELLLSGCHSDPKAKNPDDNGCITAILGDVFVPWHRFQHILAGSPRFLIDVSSATLIIYRLLPNLTLKYFQTAAPSLGIAHQFADTILALKRNGIDAKRLRGILETRGSMKEGDLLTVFHAYENYLSDRGLKDTGSTLNDAIAAIRTGASPLLLEKKIIILDEFRRFEPGQREIIEQIAKAHPETQIFISLPEPESEDDIYASYLNKSIERIEDISDDRKILRDPSLPSPPREPRSRGEAGGSLRMTPPDVQIRSMRSPLQEARYVADEISKLVRDDDSDIVLCWRSGSSFLDEFFCEARSRRLLEDDGTFTALCNNTPLLNELTTNTTVSEWPYQASPIEFLNLCRDFVERGERLSRLREDLPTGDCNRKEIAREIAALGCLDAALEGIRLNCKLIGIESIRREDFVWLLTSIVSQNAISSPRLLGRLPIRAVQYDSGLAVPTDFVFMPNMSGGFIPRMFSERLFFSDMDTLAPEPDTTIDEIFPNGSDILADESYLFETFMRKSRKAITLSYPAIGESGNEVAASPFIEGLGKAIPADPLPSVLSESFDYERLQELISVESERLARDVDASNFEGILKDPRSRDVVRKRFEEKMLSASSLETYAKCPFDFFAKKVLGLEPLEEETPEIQPKDRGTIVHSLLELFYSRHVDSFKMAIADPSQIAKIEKIVDALLDEVLSEHAGLVCKSAPGLKSFQRDHIKSMAMQTIEMEIHQAAEVESPLMPAECEWNFGVGEIPPLTLDMDGDPPLRLTGCVDRVDVSADKKSFLVVDYKTGTDVKAVNSAILKGEHMQLPIYVEAVRRLLLPKAYPLGGLLLAVRAAEKRHGFVRKEFNGVHYDVGGARSKLTDDKWDENSDAALCAVRKHAKAIRGGEFQAASCEHCRTCDYANACRCNTKGTD